MAILKPAERRFAEAVSGIVYANPFLPERIALEREALGDQFQEEGSNWNLRAESEGSHPNIARLTERTGELSRSILERLARGAHPTSGEIDLYEATVLFHLYHVYFQRLSDLIRAEEESPKGRTRVSLYGAFLEDLRRLLFVPGLGQISPGDPEHILACFYQLRRAFHHIFGFIVGSSRPIARLRAATWQSIFTHDMRRYRSSLYDRMGDFTTLITGPSGTGKELVARAIGLSRYLAFDSGAQAFTEASAGSFHALSLSELSPTLIESELFGHRRGSFTGALDDRAGWLEVCKPQGTVFLDEVGEIVPPVQVKLLRVLQTRTFQRIGDTAPLRFRGKIIAATNRDLSREVREGRFRRDLYYRLCADMITTPSLREQLAESPAELPRLALFIARRVAGGAGEALASEVVAWIEDHLGHDHAWPGNFRELEQCVRNVLIRGEYHPLGAESAGVRERLSDEFLQGSLTADDLLSRYATLVYARTGSYEAASRILRLDRRTVRKRVDARLLSELRRPRA